jgi:FkbM family methyltransferase
MKYLTLPNRCRIAIIDQFTALDIYQEIFTDNLYLRKGLKVNPKDVVIDIGGHIGLFSLFILEQAPQIRLITIEPIPQIFIVLQENIEKYQPAKSSVTMLNIGLADKEGKSEFNFYPRLSSNSSAIPIDFDRQTQSYLALTDMSAARILPLKLKTWIIHKILRWIYASQKVECEQKTLSQIIEELQLERIDLIKLDAENAEWGVIAGIGESDWPKIQQMVIEVHTHIPKGQTLVDDLTSLLTHRGFFVTVDLNARFSDIGVHMLYAKRCVN